MTKEVVKKLEGLVSEITESILLTNNGLWNQAQGTMLKAFTGALCDIQQYNSKKYGKNTPAEEAVKTPVKVGK